MSLLQIIHLILVVGFFTLLDKNSLRLGFADSSKTGSAPAVEIHRQANSEGSLHPHSSYRVVLVAS